MKPHDFLVGLMLLLGIAAAAALFLGLVFFLLVAPWYVVIGIVVTILYLFLSWQVSQLRRERDDY